MTRKVTAGLESQSGEERKPFEAAMKRKAPRKVVEMKVKVGRPKEEVENVNINLNGDKKLVR